MAAPPDDMEPMPDNEPPVSRMPTQADEAADRDFIIQLVHNRSGIRLRDGKPLLIRAWLEKPTRHRGFETPGLCCDSLRRPKPAIDEKV